MKPGSRHRWWRSSTGRPLGLCGSKAVGRSRCSLSSGLVCVTVNPSKPPNCMHVFVQHWHGMGIHACSCLRRSYDFAQDAADSACRQTLPAVLHSCTTRTCDLSRPPSACGAHGDTRTWPTLHARTCSDQCNQLLQPLMLPPVLLTFECFAPLSQCIPLVHLPHVAAGMQGSTARARL